MRLAILGAVLGALVGSSAHAADTLVVAGADGKYTPGAAKSWSEAGGGLTFVLQDGIDGEKTAATLRERLAQAKVTFAGGKLSIIGIPTPALLDQLSALSLSGEADPLAALAGLGGGGGGSSGPEGGGSIRASKPTPLPPGAFPGTVAPGAAAHGPDERFEAEVIDVTRGVFPQVKLKLRIKKVAKSGALKGKLVKNKVVEAPVVVSQGDLGSADGQRNLAGYYLMKGDRVSLHAIEPKDGELAVDWLERRQGE
jgi:hypothetical protein